MWRDAGRMRMDSDLRVAGSTPSGACADAVRDLSVAALMQKLVAAGRTKDVDLLQKLLGEGARSSEGTRARGREGT